MRKGASIKPENTHPKGDWRQVSATAKVILDVFHRYRPFFFSGQAPLYPALASRAVELGGPPAPEPAPKRARTEAPPAPLDLAALARERAVAQARDRARHAALGVLPRAAGRHAVVRASLHQNRETLRTSSMSKARESFSERHTAAKKAC